MNVDYKTRKSAPLVINGYTSVVTLLRQSNLDVREIDRRQEWIKEEDPPNLIQLLGNFILVQEWIKEEDPPENWDYYTHAQIYSPDRRHIGDIVGRGSFVLVTYNGFPQEVLETIVSKGYLTRELTTPKEGVTETHLGFN